MAKLRRNHTGKGRNASGGRITKVGIFGAILAAIIYLFGAYVSPEDFPIPAEPRLDYAGEDYYLPAPSGGEIVRHRGFTLSYNEDWEQAEWVAYLLERENLRKTWSDRKDNFREDPAVSSGSAGGYDYRGSGYDRGHLAPFADFAWSAELADETFYMSNISPQARQFNQGVWRELEELTRDWANKYERLYVVTGPVMTQDPKGTIGRETRVAIPVAYFKVLLDLDDPEQKGIGFVIPNEISFDPLPKYAMSIDEVEAITNLDFFPELMPAAQEANLEAVGNPDLWTFSKKKYDKRMKSWNNVRN
ncbi:DNA/RNA non-specific endonuclease [Neolewinella antarctica]|uniref:Endonuclease n=1 Tax=Neolewinella antarctica TaxID=442734 RepID=A0ABX0XB54_9BACT|nr:DNA/RNA non-specific endonuclease [Neolewinella antarctica]NJC26196.1 endonuclease G [Neolewinella antarctica]